MARISWLALVAVLVLTAKQSFAQLCFCFNSTGAKSVFTVKMELPDEDWKRGFVQYDPSKAKIPIVFIGSEELEHVEGRPSYMKYTWREMVGGKQTGLYMVCIQGANVYEGYYIRGKDKKKFKLERISTDDDCTQCFNQ